MLHKLWVLCSVIQVKVLILQFINNITSVSTLKKKTGNNDNYLKESLRKSNKIMYVKQLCTLKNNAKTNYCIFLISTMTLVGFNAMTLSQNKGDENKSNSIKFQKKNYLGTSR